MLNIPEVIKELFLQDGVRKNFRVHFPNGERADLVNKDIIEESVKFTESTCSQQTLRFGLTEASVIEFECVGVGNIAGMTIECGIEIDVSSLSREDREAYGTRTDDVSFPFYAVPYGVFVVDKCPRQADMKRRKVTAYTEYDVDYYASIDGTYKNMAIKLTPSQYREIMSTRDDDMTEMARKTTGVNSLLWNSTDNRNLYLSVANYAVMGAAGGSAELPIPTNAPTIVKCFFQPDPLDERADELFRIANASRISGDYLYYFGQRQYANMNEGAFNEYGGIRPFIRVRAGFSGEDHYRAVFSIIIKNGERVVIDPKSIVRAYGSGGELQYMYITVIVPVEWYGADYAYWILTNYAGGNDTYKTITNWPLAESHTRGGEVRAIYKTMTTGDQGEPDISIESTQKISYPGGGIYYNYENAISPTDAANGVLEMEGTFGNIQRSGALAFKALDGVNRYKLELERIASLWFEEYITRKIGTVVYPYIDENDEQVIGELYINDAPGVYDMSGNRVLQTLADKSQAGVEEAILRMFPTNVENAFYKPINLEIKGLPWLEDGDAIRIETEDGEVVDSYIMRHTISGVQHLVDDIEAQGEV